MLRLPSRASSHSASTSSSSLRVQVRSEPRNRFLASCCVSVEPPCATRPRTHVGEGRADHAGGVEAPVLEEAPVLGGDHRIDEMARQQIDRDVGVAAAALAQERAVAGQHAHDRRMLLEAQRHGIGDVHRVVGQRDGGEEEEGRPEVDDRQDGEPDFPRQAPEQPGLARACCGAGCPIGLGGVVKAHRLCAVPGTQHLRTDGIAGAPRLRYGHWR